jgi:vacuolar-type H+-ATPase subunit F/Vma7
MHLLHRLLQPRLNRNGFMTPGKYPRKLRAKTLYDRLGVRPDDDAETLQSAFRDAAKEHHPDLNPGDPDAPRRFRQMVTAYEILRDAEQRGAYDWLLALERAQRRAKLTRTIVSDAAAVVAFTVVLFAQVPKTSVEVVEVAAHKPADIIAIQRTIWAETANRVQPSERLLEVPGIVTVPSAVTSRMNSDSPTAIANGRPAETDVAEPAADTSHRGEPNGKSARGELAGVPIVPSAVVPEAKSSEPLIIANGGPAPDPTGSKNEIAKAVNALDSRVDRGDKGDGADDHKKNDEPNSLDQNRVLSVEPQFSSSERDTSLAKSPSSNLAIFNGKHYVRTTGKLRVLAKRPATDRASVRQAAAAESRDMLQVALESRNTSACAGSCSNRAPPLFGVGF